MMNLAEEFNFYNQKTKAHTDLYRPFFALNRNSAGFNKKDKELVYTLVCNRAEDAYVFDIDDKKYIDLTMGFGSIFFGHNYQPLNSAIKEQLDLSWSVGPISPLAGELAKEIYEVTGCERSAFFNSGTEAVMVAIRLAKAKTKKTHFVFFKGAYHGTFDPLLSLKTDDGKIAQELVPGVTQNILNESYLLDYGTQESLDFIKNNKDSIAGILIEPVQSRRPDFFPIEFIKELRAFTLKSNIALIFDEVITGFRMNIGGCQAILDIKADIVCYGKVIGGGLPIGIVSGKPEYLDYTDGGKWKFGDDSQPNNEMTFVAGTFCHHPLALRTALKTIELLKNNIQIQEQLESRTKEMCKRLNNFFNDEKINVKVVHFGSLFRFITPGKTKYIYHLLLLNGVYIWEGRNCFLSVAHDDKVIEALEQKIKSSALSLKKI